VELALALAVDLDQGLALDQEQHPEQGLALAHLEQVLELALVLAVDLDQVQGVELALGLAVDLVLAQEPHLEQLLALTLEQQILQQEQEPRQDQEQELEQELELVQVLVLLTLQLDQVVKTRPPPKTALPPIPNQQTSQKLTNQVFPKPQVTFQPPPIKPKSLKNQKNLLRMILIQAVIAVKNVETNAVVV